MSELFAHVYLDEDVSVLLATLLRSRGFEAETTVEAGNLAATDDRQLEYAASHKSVLLKHNRADFERLAAQYLLEKKTHAGIIIAVRRLPHEMLRRLLALLNRNTADEFANNVWYL